MATTTHTASTVCAVGWKESESGHHMMHFRMSDRVQEALVMSFVHLPKTANRGSSVHHEGRFAAFIAASVTNEHE